MGLGLQFLGSVGQGVSAGIQDWQRMDEAEQRKQMFEWQKKQQQRDEALDAALEKVPTSTYTQQGGVDDGDPGISVATPRKQSDILRDRAAAVAGLGGAKNLGLSLQLQNAATAEGRRESVDDINKKYQGYFGQLDKGDIGGVMTAFNNNQLGGTAADNYVTVKGKDGQLHVYQRDALHEGPRMTFKDANEVRDALSHARMHELSLADPESYAKLVLESQKIGNDKDFHNNYLGVQNRHLDLQSPLWAAQANAANAQAGLARSQQDAGKVVGQPVQMTGPDGQTALGIATRDAKGKVSFNPIQMPQGYKFSKPSTGELKADANGNYSDGTNVYRLDAKSNTLVPILNPGNVKDLADSIAKNLPAKKDVAPAAAATEPVVEDKKTAEKKFVRSKSPRGGYTYTESPRGLTRSEYAKIDAEKSK